MDTVTIAQFRVDYPEFVNATTYPDSQVQRFLTLAALRLNQDRWDELWSYGVELYTAHNLSLGQMRVAAAAAGKAPGATTGITTSSSVGGVSKGVDIGTVTTEGAGTYNLTSYGSEFWQLAQQIGIGGLQVGAGDISGASADLGSMGAIPYFPYG